MKTEFTRRIRTIGKSKQGVETLGFTLNKNTVELLNLYPGCECRITIEVDDKILRMGRLINLANDAIDNGDEILIKRKGGKR